MEAAKDRQSVVRHPAVRIGRSAIRPRTLWPLGADLLLYEDEIRSVERSVSVLGV